MNKNDSYQNLNFQRPPRKMSSKLIAAGLILASFTLLVLVVPQSSLYWILIVPLIGLTWSATYGFRSALSDLIKILQRIEHN